jgi:hypothetical protein
VARVLAQASRHGAIYLALRELLSFRGSEFYLEPVPKELVGQSFESAHSRVHGGVAVGVMHAKDGLSLVPRPDGPPLLATDRLVMLEEDAQQLRLGGSLPAAPGVQDLRIEDTHPPQTIAVLGFNRSLSCLITELDQTLPHGSSLRLRGPMLDSPEETVVHRAQGACGRVSIEREVRTLEELARLDDPAVLESDGVVILGCENEFDPDGDASALALLLQLRHKKRSQGLVIKRLITEVRDPHAAQQIAGTVEDFLVSTDVVAMLLAHSVFDPDLTAVYREILNPGGAELFLRPRRYYVPDGPITFGQLMAAVRRRGDVALGFYPHVHGDEPCPRIRIELGQIESDEVSHVWLNPPRETMIPSIDGTAIVVLSRDPIAGPRAH